MDSRVDTKRILIFLALAYGIAWAVALVVYLTGGLVNSPQLAPGLSLALILIATGYMWAPALAHLLTRAITRESWRDTGLRPNFRRGRRPEPQGGWPYWLAAWVVPAVATMLGSLVFFALYPQFYDPSLGVVRQMLAQAGQPDLIDPWLVVGLQLVQGILMAPLLNGLFTFGEEFGWRAYLQPKLMPLGGRRAMLLMGAIWGVWHWPVIAMGHNYGLEYPGAPWTGLLAMVWFTFTVGTFLGWVTLRGGSVWPAVIGHAALNGIAGVGILFAQGTPNPLLGPLPTGLVGGLPWAILALVLLLIPGALRPARQGEPAAASTAAQPAAEPGST